MSGQLEIERKFLPERVPDDLLAVPAVPIQQGYLAVDGGVEVRLRRYGDARVLTIKSGTGLVRLEEELELDERRFTALWPLTEGRRLEKSRRALHLADDVLVELDEYHGDLDGLWVAEVEFPTTEASAAFAAPAWMGREVTGDERYANRALAMRGRPG